MSTRQVWDMKASAPLGEIAARTDQQVAAAPARADVVCGTDFSLNAKLAVEVAAAFAHRLGSPLVLSHGLQNGAHDTLPDKVRDSLSLFARAQMGEELELLRAREVSVIADFSPGTPTEVLVAAVRTFHASLLVVSSHGTKHLARYLVGSVAEEVSQRSPAPTLVVRAKEPFLAWCEGKRRLRVLVVVDFGLPASAALQWVRWLQKIGLCEVIAVYLDSSLAMLSAADGEHSPTVLQMLNRSEEMRHRSLKQRVRDVLGTDHVKIKTEGGWEHSDAHVLELTRQERADLLVVGTHQRHGLARLVHHSVSRSLVRYAPMSVACVPISFPSPELSLPPFENFVL